MKKILALLLIGFAVCQADIYDDERDKLKQYHDECKAGTGVDETLVTKAEGGEFTDDVKLKEHIFCISQKMGFQKEDGAIDKDAIKSYLKSFQYDDAKADTVLKTCAVQKDTPEITAYEMIKCYYENSGLF